MDTFDTAKKIHNLNNSVHENASSYFHTTPLAVSKTAIILPNGRKHNFEIVYDIKDLFTIAAVTQSTMLLTGGTDVGKTALSKLMLNGFFGKEEEGWHRIDIDSDFGKDSYTNVDFSAITEGKKLTNLYDAMPYLSMPGLMVDEINRAHAALSNKLLHVFDKDISLPDGSRKKIGVPVKDGKTYQFQIAAVNEGSDYSGTFDIDRALRRRTVMEIPMDVFPINSYDRLCLQKNKSKGLQLKNEKNQLKDVLAINESIEDMSLHPTAEMFVNYLGAFNFCKNSLSGEKGSVSSRSGSLEHICTKPIKFRNSSENNGDIGCEFIKAFENNLCAYVRGVTPGVTKNLINVAKGFALLRANKFIEMLSGIMSGKPNRELCYSIKNNSDFEKSLQAYVGKEMRMEELARAAAQKYLKNLEVGIEDIDSALGFVGYSKIGIAEPWVIKHYQGNRYEAVKAFSAAARNKFEEGLSQPIFDSLSEILKENKTEDMEKIKGYCNSKNPWLWQAIVPYTKEKPGENRKDILKLYGD